MWLSRHPRDPPPFMANAILNFHFDFPHTSLIFLIVLRILDMDVSRTSHSLFSDLLLLPLFVQQWPGDEKSQCWPWYLPHPHIIAVINIVADINKCKSLSVTPSLSSCYC